MSGWLLGTVLQLQQASIWSFHLVWAVGSSSVFLGFLAWVLRHKTSQMSKCVIGVLIAFGLALSGVNARCLWQAQQRLNPLLEGKEILLVGVIASLPQQSEISVRFRFQVETALDLEQASSVVVPEWLDLAWYDRESADLMKGSHWADLKAGDTWQFSVRLKAPHGSLNPGGFDEALWRWEQGVMATGSVSTGKRAKAPQKIDAIYAASLSVTLKSACVI